MRSQHDSQEISSTDIAGRDWWVGGGGGGEAGREGGEGDGGRPGQKSVCNNVECNQLNSVQKTLLSVAIITKK